MKPRELFPTAKSLCLPLDHVEKLVGVVVIADGVICDEHQLFNRHEDGDLAAVLAAMDVHQ